jgi:hypothetical protein
MTPQRKQYIYAIEDLSSHSHTAEFNFQKMVAVIDQVGATKFSAVVSDAEAAMQAAKRRVATKYPHIIPIRCIAHHIQLITSDIMKLPWAKQTLSSCQTIVSFFRNSYPAGAMLRDEIMENWTIGGNLHTTTKTRWSTAWDCCESLLRNETNIKMVCINSFILLIYK